MPDYWEPTGPIVLSAPAPHTSTFETDPVSGFRRCRRIKLTLDVTAAATLVGDTLDVIVDVDGIGAVHFDQILGNGGVQKRVAFLEPGLPATADVDVTADPAAGVVRPYLWGDELNVRATIAGSGGESFTFGVTAEGQA